MRALRLAPVLLALAACTVETASLKPKSAAECADLGQKVCGNRCMPITLENGCGQPGCVPCPEAPLGFEAYCDGGAPSACATRPVCQTGSAYCEGPYDTSCDDIATSGVNCGACGHSCGGAACNNYACDPAGVLAASANPPPDIASDGVSYYWPINNVPTPGTVSLFRSAAPATPLAQWTARPTRLEVDAYGAVLWSRLDGESIWEVRGGVHTLLFTPSSGVRSLALDPGYAYFSELGSTASNESAVDLIEINRAQNATPGFFGHHTFAGDGGLTAVALERPLANDSRALAGTESGALRWLSYDLASAGTYATGIEPPVAMAAYHGQFGGVTTPRTIAFWVGATGNLYGKILPDGPIVNLTGWTTSSTGGVDMYVDGDGVYWVDSGFQGANVGASGTWGLVGEWRASYDDVVILYLSPTGRPVRVAATSTHVGWIDGVTGAVLEVHK